MNIGIDQARTDAVDANALRRHLQRQPRCQRIHRPLGRGVIHIFTRCAQAGRRGRDIHYRPALAAMFEGHAFYRFPAAEEVARDVGRQDAVNALGGEILNGGLLKQNPRIIDQRGQRLAFTIEAVKHRQHLSFITDVCPNGKGFTARLNNLVDHVRCGLNVVMIVHRHGVAFAGQLQRSGLPYAPAGAGHKCNAHFLLPIKKPGGGFALPGLRYYISNVTGIRSSARRSRTGYGRRRHHQDASRSASICSPRLPGRRPARGNSRGSTRPPARAGCAER